MKYGEHRSSKNTQGALPMVIVGGMILAGIAAAVYHGSHKHPPLHIRIYLASDVSSSHSPDQRKHDFGVLNRALDSVFPPRSTIETWAFDHSAWKFSERAPDESIEMKKIEKALTDYISTAQKTRPGEALEQINAALAQPECHGCPAVVILDWDAGAEEGVDKLKAQVNILAKNPDLKALWIIGAKPDLGLRSAVDRIFAPLGAKLIVTGPLDGDTGSNKLQSILDAAEEKSGHE